MKQTNPKPYLLTDLIIVGAVVWMLLLQMNILMSGQELNGFVIFLHTSQHCMKQEVPCLVYMN